MDNNHFSRSLLNWYYKAKRDLPWRGEIDFYKVWISEVMLQQTQVKTVVPFYHKWIERFPDINSVANASEDEVLKIWEGLGYYARARNFKKSCEIIVNKNDDINRITIDEFKAFPGVGDYISSAVFSIVRATPVPVIDANVKRVMSRIMMLNLSPEKCKSEILDFLKILIPDKFPGDFNQAIMELGATLCKPKSPECRICPIETHCRAYLNNTVNKYPVKSKIKKKPHHNIAVGIIWKDDKILITKRKPSGLLGGLWEFPGGKVNENESLENCVMREIKEELEINIKVVEFIKAINHAYTHFSITMNAFHCEFVNGTPTLNTCTGLQFITINDFDKYPFPKANHKLFPYINQLEIQV